MLRDYQEKALTEISAEWRNGKRSVLLVLPTGAGKTAVAGAALRMVGARGKSALFLAHRRELISQASKRLTSEGIAHGVVMAGVAPTKAFVQIASIDTLRARNERPLADLVIWDEAHHTGADSWGDIHERYPTAYHLGLTATPCRADGQGLGSVFDSMVVGATVAQLTEQGYLVPCDIEAPARKLKNQEIAQDPVDLYLGRFMGGTPLDNSFSAKALVYAGSVQEAHELAKRFVACGVNAAAIDGTTKSELRDEVLQRFASGEIRVLVNMAVLTEGFDCPDAEVCIVARSVGHVGLWLQIVGRVLRPALGKTRALVLDLAGNVHQHGLPAEPRTYSLEGEGIVATASESAPALCRNCGASPLKYPCWKCKFMPPEVKRTITGELLFLVGGKFEPKDEKTAVDELVLIAAQKKRKIGWICYAFKERYGYEISRNRYVAARAQYETLRENREAATERDPARPR